MLKTTNAFQSENVVFAFEWINSTASAGRDSYCMYSHTSAFNHLSSPFWLTYLFSFLLNKKKIRIEDETGRRGVLSRLPLVPKIHTCPSRDLKNIHISRVSVCFILFFRLEWLVFTQLCSVYHPMFIVSCSSNQTMLVQINL